MCVKISPTLSCKFITIFKIILFNFAAMNTGEYYCKIMWNIHEVLSTPPQALTVSSETTGRLFIFHT